ncbi:MAG: ribonuclease Z [Prevotella sp.]|nr:ribonuclease Z [Prevotella sp.]
MEPFRVHILGCGSALPTLRHYPSAQIVEVREKLFMVDCGEGVQMQLRRCHVRFTKVSHVFISHLHGDHCFGLIGMISTFGLVGRTATLHIHANELLNDMLQRQMALFCHDLGYDVVFHPLDATRRDVIYEDRSLTVETIPLTHRLPTCGFLFREKPLLPHIRHDMIDFYQIPTSQIQNIKNGADWTLEDGTVVPNARLVTPADAPRSYAYCSDTRYMPELHKQLKGVTTLYHESTYGEDNLQMAQKYNHSTARQAAMVARDAGVGQLVLGHYSSRYEDETVLLNEAREVFENVRLSNEMDVINV